ncbi:SPOR domain-containing protein [Zhongshania aquimaris]|uniref:SPOR domain-containing protein n=1 Tax=Zhongshania aquimaris TaxID=2857107 RepID=A0ABS6VX03_9GAMM|nr:hypothetical protein [Zhongshania aquimaris]MBW2942847.1 hypothetical protein [Zhongshania aquimaris]
MRWFFLLLLAINAVFFASHWTSSSSGGFDLPLVSAEKNNISLLSELDREGSLSANGALNIAITEPSVEEVCLLLGPYKAKEELGGVIDEISGSELLIETYERSADYWVYLGPYSSFSGAAKVSSELRDRRIDNFIIRSGELQNAISLGVFTTDERANVHSKGLLKKGYSAAVKRVVKEGERYWLSFRGREGEDGYVTAAKLMQENVDNNKSLEKKSCNLIASYKELD